VVTLEKVDATNAPKALAKGHCKGIVGLLNPRVASRPAGRSGEEYL